MGRTPPRARRRAALAAVLSLLAIPAFAGPADGAGKPADAVKPGGSSASGKPGNGNGGGGGNHGGRGGGRHGGGNGGGNGGGGPRGGGNGGGGPRGGGNGGGGPAAAPTSGNSVASGGSTGGGGGGGGGGGNGNGNGNRGGRASSGGGRGFAAQGSGGSAGSGNRTASGSAANGGGSNPASAPSTGSSNGQATAAAAAPAAAPAAASPTSSEPRGSGRERGRRSRGQTAAQRRRARAAARAAAGRPAGRGATTAPSGAAAAATAVAAALPSAPAGATTGRGTESGGRSNGRDAAPAGDSPVVVRTFRSIVEVVPGFIKAVIAALSVALLVASAAWFLLARNARFLRRQREKLVGEIGVLQGALLPNVPPELSRLEASVAYRPAEGLAAGGDFYDAFPLDRGQVGIVVGDVAGHGKDALMHTALLRYTMRAYLEAGLEPRGALQVAGRVLDRGFDTLATVVLAIYDPAEHVLRYATAGHPPPVFLGPADHVPVTRSSSPPIGAMLPTGLRQTTVWLPAGSAVCFFTDGLIEARREGGLIGRLGLVEIIRELGPRASAAQLLNAVADRADHVGDDMAACMFRVADGPAAEDAPGRLEELELSASEPVAPILEPFLTGCGLAEHSIERRVADAEQILTGARAAIVRVSFDRIGPPSVSIAPANVESLAAAQAVRAAG
jgi:Stage II sporulation protein E (SpoIIE)